MNGGNATGTLLIGSTMNLIQYTLRCIHGESEELLDKARYLRTLLKYVEINHNGVHVCSRCILTQNQSQRL